MPALSPAPLAPEIDPTRVRLIEAAGEVFAETGFRNARIRDICTRAGTNIAAVNYHFGGKMALYAAVLRYAHRIAIERYPPDLGTTPESTAAERLHAFIRSFLLRIFDKGKPAYFEKLVSREMIDPTEALDALVETDIRPRAQQLGGIIMELLGGHAEPATIRDCSISVVSQVIFYHQCWPVCSRLFDISAPTPDAVDRLADHITRFCLDAILARRVAAPTKPRPVAPSRPPARPAVAPRRRIARPRRTGTSG